MTKLQEATSHHENDSCNGGRGHITKEQKIGMLRQWLNEDRIDDPKKMVTNEDIKYWLK